MIGVKEFQSIDGSVLTRT